MAEITIGKAEWPGRVRVVRGDEQPFDEHLSIHEMVTWITQGHDLAIYVDGWREPWPLFVHDCVLRARCPTAPKCCPKVVEESRVDE